MEFTKLGLISPSPYVNTGYGRMARMYSQKMMADKIDHIILGNQHFSDNMNLNGVTVTPRGTDPYLKDVLPYLVQRHKVDCLVNVFDFWAMDYLQYLKPPTPYIHYIPIDCNLESGSLSPSQEGNLKKAKAIFTISRYSYEQLKKIGIESTPIPLGVDSTVYKPLDNKSKLRKQFGLSPDDYIIGFVGKNITTRKDIPNLLKAVRIFKDNLLPSDAKRVKIYLHTNTKYTLGGNVDIERLIKYYKFSADEVYFSPYNLDVESYSDELMNMTYNLFDVAAFPSRGEGFNLPLLEAMSCGIPIVAHNVSAHKELLEDTQNAKVGSASSDYALWTDIVTEYPVIDVNQMADSFSWLYYYPKSSPSLKELCEKNISKAKTYTWEKSYESLIKGIKEA